MKTDKIRWLKLRIKQIALEREELLDEQRKYRILLNELKDNIQDKEND